MCSFVACLGSLTIDHASVLRRITAPTQNRHLQHLGARYVFSIRLRAGSAKPLPGRFVGHAVLNFTHLGMNSRHCCVVRAIGITFCAGPCIC